MLSRISQEFRHLPAIQHVRNARRPLLSLFLSLYQLFLQPILIKYEDKNLFVTEEVKA